MAKEQKASALSPLVLWFYNKAPDGICRLGFLEQLVERGACPSEILFEAQWDSYTFGRNFARAQWIFDSKA